VTESRSPLTHPGPECLPLMRAVGISKTFRGRGHFRRQTFAALQQIDLEIPCGTTFGIVGVSGAGKSTLAMCMAQLETIDAGLIWYKGQDVTKVSPAERIAIRRKVQLIFQDSALSFNPRMIAVEIVSEPLDILGSGTKKQRRESAFECMRMAGLSTELADRRPLELSGGQRQRLAIARALTLSPELLIFDESFSGVDLVLEAQILELLTALKISRGLTYVIITHDLGLVAGVAEQVAVMQSGRIVEQGPVAQVFSHAEHGHTQALLAAMPKWNLARTAGAEA
jgi:peptide/nickel transport system ATP-binding protein